MKDALDRFFHESGFIFSYSTLAAFLRGLFPEGEGDISLDTSFMDESEFETRPIQRGELAPEDQETEGETSRFARTGDTTLQRGRLDMSKVKDYAASSVFGPLGEDNTVVGSLPNLDKAEWSEAETVIRPLLSEMDTDDAGKLNVERTHTGPAESDLDLPLPEPDPRPRPSPPRERRPSSSQFRRTQVIGLALGIIIVVAALLVGFLLGSQAAKLTGISQDPVTVNSDPVLEVHMPEGSVLYVDGFKIPGASPVSKRLVPGRSHDIRVTIPDHLPVETSIRLESNDMRVLQIEPIVMQSRPKKSRNRRR
jgi:hypothetical protein